jgi:uncharacterized protein (TIGR03435 family)
MLLLLLVAALPALAQPVFDVANVKPAAGTRSSGYSHQTTATSFTALHVSMGHLLRYAYDIHTAYELAGPAWLDPPTEQEYDVVAKVNRPVAEEEVKAMLRSLLAERFHLQAHRETRDLPAFLLVAVKPTLRPAAAPGPPRHKSGDKPFQDRFESYTTAQLAQQLGPPWTSRPVLDRTGLTGAYDFELDLSRYILDPETGKQILDWRGAVDLEGALLRALPEQLGLALKPQRAPYQVLIVDHADKSPTSN